MNLLISLTITNDRLFEHNFQIPPFQFQHLLAYMGDQDLYPMLLHLPVWSKVSKPKTMAYESNSPQSTRDRFARVDQEQVHGQTHDAAASTGTPPRTLEASRTHRVIVGDLACLCLLAITPSKIARRRGRGGARCLAATGGAWRRRSWSRRRRCARSRRRRTGSS